MLKVKLKLAEIVLAVLLVALGVMLRLLPHWPNFAPVTALALFGGCYFSKRLALMVPLSVMLISDFFLGFYEWPVALAVYGSFMAAVALGSLLKHKKQWPWIAGGSLMSSLIFFAATNLAVWAFTPWYAKTFSGLAQCFVLALPFWRNTLLGDLFYTGVFFAGYELISLGISFTIKKARLRSLAAIK